eukprot:4883336-Pyramimonas_sp.AAC.1
MPDGTAAAVAPARRRCWRTWRGAYNIRVIAPKILVIALNVHLVLMVQRRRRHQQGGGAGGPGGVYQGAVPKALRFGGGKLQVPRGLPREHEQRAVPGALYVRVIAPNIHSVALNVHMELVRFNRLIVVVHQTLFEFIEALA